MEAAVVIARVKLDGVDTDVPVYWHDPSGRTIGSLPDSRDLWEVLWENRENLVGVAHTHPGDSVRPSDTDFTTFAAVEAGLGKRLVWWIASRSRLSLTDWDPRHGGYGTITPTSNVGGIDWDYGWLPRLREISGMEEVQNG